MKYKYLLLFFCTMQQLVTGMRPNIKNDANAQHKVTYHITARLRPKTYVSESLVFYQERLFLLKLLHRRNIGEIIDSFKYDLSNSDRYKFCQTKTKPKYSLLMHCMQVTQQFNDNLAKIKHAYMIANRKESNKNHLQSLHQKLYCIGTLMDQWVQTCTETLTPLFLETWLRFCANILSPDSLEDLLDHCVDYKYPKNKTEKEKETRKGYYQELTSIIKQTQKQPNEPIGTHLHDRFAHSSQSTNFPFYYATYPNTPAQYITQPSMALTGAVLIPLKISSDTSQA